VTSRRGADIRLARPTDTDELFRLATLLATSEVPHRHAFDGSLQAILEDAHQVVLVATPEEGPGLIGYLHGLTHAAFHANGDVGWVEELLVEEESRAAGVGRRLMAAFEEWASTRATDVRYLAVATRRAAGFYRALGYQESAAYFTKSR
jgi:GNAT superfamily N-acetyltransferase